MKQHSHTRTIFGNIPFFAVDPKFQGKGVGTLLLKSLLKNFNDIDAKYVTLCTDLSNSAIKLYEKFGFLCILSSRERYFDGTIMLNFINHLN